VRNLTLLGISTVTKYCKEEICRATGLSYNYTNSLNLSEKIQMSTPKIED
jgi:hypothetical protein